MATAWVLGKVSDALAPTVSNAVSSAGSMAGGAVNAVGNGINGVGSGINNSIKRYGDGAKDYGNSIMDWTKADGIRGQTAGNPLGLGGSAASGKGSVTSPNVYSAPLKPAASKTLTTTSKTTAPTKKAIGAPTKKAASAPTSRPKSNPPPKQSAITGAKTPTPVVKKTPSSLPAGVKGVTGRPGAIASKVTGPVKASTASVTNAKTSVAQKAKPNYVGAANPLGMR